MSTNDILFKMDKPDLSNGIVDGYAEYLSGCVAEMKFVDVANLKEYFKAHLNIFFSEAISDIQLGGYDKRINDLKKENEQLSIDRAEMEEEILKAKSRLRERKFVDTEWLARYSYAFKMKGIRIQSNCREIGRLGDIISKNVQKKHRDKDHYEKDLFCQHLRDKIGKEDYIKLWNEVKERHDLNGFDVTKEYFNGQVKTGRP
jgi:hypothetical protein